MMSSSPENATPPKDTQFPEAFDDIAAMEQARRAAAERARRLAGIRAVLRGFLLGVFSIGVIGGLLYGVRYAIALPYFNLTKLVLVGDTNKVSPVRLREAIEPAIRGNFFTVDMEEVRDAAQKVPWVKSVSIRRVWPNEMVVNFTTRRAIATYEDGRLVDEQGELFVGNPDEQETSDTPLPSFSGTAAQIPQIVRYYQEFSRAVRPLGVTVTEVFCSDRGSWSLTVSSKDIPPTKIDLGLDRAGSESVIEKLVNVVAAYPSIRELLQGPPASIDARYNHAFSASPPNKDYQAPVAQDLDVPETGPEGDAPEAGTDTKDGKKAP